MNRSLDASIATSLIEQLVFFDEQRQSLLERFYPDHHRDRRRIEQLMNRYRNRLEQIIAGNNTNTLEHTVLIGSYVKVRNEEDGTMESYCLVLPDDANMEEHCISFLSPIGQELLLSDKGQTITVQTPAGSYQLIVAEIDFHLPA
ncbi:GreA/GreB family elongation factor [Paenibacillus oenotherae]|uniref:GreA/GreB family elongation factor n=1 Tax=Paenibacillus oenotherae TaxID=1435645 RepID=A0ABS7DA78_9BACL|nr:GreA/GreB family elongation factor [Paenibacillus oenotherae]MBW7476791.1 GreA/GreB family elongation factor [Paenibacillus oenotherae]